MRSSLTSGRKVARVARVARIQHCGSFFLAEMERMMFSLGPLAAFFAPAERQASGDWVIWRATRATRATFQPLVCGRANIFPRATAVGLFEDSKQLISAASLDHDADVRRQATESVPASAPLPGSSLAGLPDSASNRQEVCVKLINPSMIV